MKEIYQFSRDRFDHRIEFCLKSKTTSHSEYTYIARRGNENIYKIGMSRDPSRRESSFDGVYKGFKVLSFLEANIENELHFAVLFAGARYAFRKPGGNGPKEAFIINQDDVEHIIRHCGFRPISDFDKPFFDSLHDIESEEFLQECRELGYL